MLSGGRPLEEALVALIGFQLGQLVFGWWLWLYAVPMLVVLTLLLRAERLRRPATTRQNRQVVINRLA